MRLRVNYAKTGKLRFISAIDLGRLWERGLRKADLPIAYSEGFSPHPKVSFTDALPLGYASTGEYAELVFAASFPAAEGMVALNAAFPDGLRVLHAVEVREGDARLSKWLQASCWELSYPDGTGGLRDAVTAIDQADTVPVGRERKGEVTQVDLRPALHEISTDGDHQVRAVLHHHEVALRPTEIHAALAARVDGLDEPTLVTRIAQGKPVAEGLAEALTGEVIRALVAEPRLQPTQRK